MGVGGNQRGLKPILHVAIVEFGKVFFVQFHTVHIANIFRHYFFEQADYLITVVLCVGDGQ